MHQFPYGDMPHFRLLTAHPSFVAAIAARYLNCWPSRGDWEDPVYILSRTRNGIAWPPLQPANKEITHCPMTPPSRKRKVQDLADSPPLKRARKVASSQATNTTNSSPISSPDSRTSCKRKTRSDSDTPITPPAKRVRTRFAGPTQRAPAIGAQAAARVASPCRAARPVRAAKIRAVARMAKVA